MNRVLFITFLCLLNLSASFGQQIINNAIGFQETTTVIQDQTADPLGNIYYWGSYKGALTINGTIVEYGRGGDDFFICKTDNSGNLIWHKTFGSPLDDPGFGIEGEHNSILFDQNSLYVVWRINPQGGTIENYTNTGQEESGFFAKLDANTGNIIWQHTSNLIFYHIEKNDDGFTLFGNSKDLNYTYDQISGSTGILNNPDQTTNVAFILKTDLNGNFSFYNAILPKIGNEVKGYIYYANIDLDQNGIYKIVIQSDGESIEFQNNSILNQGETNYKNFIILTASSDLTTINSKLIPAPTTNLSNIELSAIGENSYYFLYNFWGNQTFSYEANSIETSFSTYLLEINTDFSFKNWYLINENNNRSDLNSISFLEMFESQNKLYFIANYTGKNNSPFLNFPVDNEVRNVFRSFSPTLDKNGSDKLYLISTSLDLTTIQTVELTEGKPLGSYNFFPLKKDMVIGDRYYLLKAGTKWNPWIIENMNNRLKYSFDNKADNADRTLAVSYFDDGSKLIIGHALGRTILPEEDQSRSFNNNQFDLFFLRLGVNNEVIWYKRTLSSFGIANIISQKKINNQIHLILTFGDSYSRVLGNTLKIDQQEISRLSNGPNDFFRLYAVIGLDGIQSLNEVDFLRQGGPVSRLIINESTTIDYSSSSTANEIIGTKSFSTAGASSYMMTINPITNNRIDGIQIVPQLLSSAIAYDPTDNSTILLARVTFPASSMQQSKNFRLNISPTQFQDFTINSLPGITSAQSLAVLIKINFTSGIQWIRRVGPNIIVSQGHKGLVASNDGIVFSFTNESGQLIFEDQVIPINSNLQFSNNKIPSILKMNSQGVLQNNNQFDFQKSSELKLKQIGNSYFLIGNNTSQGNVGQIAIGNEGFLDGLGIELDNQLNVVNVYRLGSPFFDNMTDLDFFGNKISFTYASQTNPSLLQGAIPPLNLNVANEVSQRASISLNRVNSIPVNDLQEDAGVLESDRCILKTWYRDNDGDGFGNSQISVEACNTPPIGYVDNATDCDDTEPTSEPCPCPTITWTKEWDKKGSKLSEQWFKLKFPNSMTIGIEENGGKTIKFTSANAIKKYLPGESGLNQIKKSLVNPTNKEIKNSLVTALIYLQLNMANNPGLKKATISKGIYKAQTIDQLNLTANIALSSNDKIEKKILKQLVEVIEEVNESFENRKSSGFVLCTNNVNSSIELFTNSTKNELTINVTDEIKKTYIIYPNPSSYKFQLNNSTKDNLEIIIMNSTGQVIDRYKNISYSQTIEFGSSYRPGIYFVKVSSSNKTIKTFKVIKQ